MTLDRLHRREFFGVTAGAALAAGLCVPGVSAAARAVGPLLPKSSASGGRGNARNVIFMVADGMSTGTLTLGELYRRRFESRGMNWTALWERPDIYRATAVTNAADSLVTDSAAGGSAWGCGSKVNNGALNITPDGKSLMPILVQARDQGKAVGVVTTTRLTHATPASFYCNCPDRDRELDIAQQLLDRKLDIALGGGSHYFPVAFTALHPGLRQISSKQELAAIGSPEAGSHILGMFNKDHMSFEVERPANEPSLAEMTDAALRVLSARPNGFVLQIEGGRVDHAAHHNDAGALIRDMVAFDDAIAVAQKFADGRDDTLVVLTTDHGNANPGLTYYTTEASTRFDRIRNVKHSFDWIEARMKAAPSSERLGKIPEIVKEAIGVDLTADETTFVAAAFQGKRAHPFFPQSEWTSVLGAVLANHLGVAFMSPHHTADMVEVTAFGPGASRLPRFLDNTLLWKLMVESLDLAPAKP